MDNQDIFGSQINMQNNMRTVHFGIFHLFKKNKNKNMMSIKKTLMPLGHLELFTLHETLFLKKMSDCMILAHSQGRYLADNQQDDSIDVVYESGAGRFWSHLREQQRLRRVCALA